jgi:hypothetical protein
MRVLFYKKMYFYKKQKTPTHIYTCKRFLY